MITIILIIFSVFCFSEEDILEKKSIDINAKVKILRKELNIQYQKIKDLYDKNAEKDEILALIEDVKKKKKDLFDMQTEYMESCKEDSYKEESYGFWDQGEITISQLVMEFGSLDYLYIIPPEIGGMKISLFSSIPIPRSSWNEMMEFILANKGIGIKKISPYLRQLYILKKELLRIEAIATSRKDLDFISDNTIVFFALEAKPEELGSIQNFFERFSDQKQIDVNAVGNKIILVAPKHNVEKLLDLKDTIFGNGNGKKIKIINLFKLKASEAEKIIKSFFYNEVAKMKPSFFKFSSDEISIVPLFDDKSIALIGDNKTVEKAEKIIFDLEEQLEEKSEMTIFWYTCKHSDPQDITDVLTRVYSSLKHIAFEEKKEKEKPKECPSKEFITTKRDFPSTAYNPTLPVKTKFVQPGTIKKDKKVAFSDNFIVDPKTGSILIVVEKSVLEKIKDLLKKLDVPKKMVQIDVLLVERKLQERKQSGINILKIGQRGNEKDTKLAFDATRSSSIRGILDFIFKQPKTSLPSIDLMMSFLMGKEDIKVNANPSILTINQTPATISIVEEISINNGAVQIDTVSGITVEKSYTRAQFGITIVMTPTIHLSSLEEKGYVTLETKIDFDTTGSSADDRPPVARRYLESEVRIADGETIILGGLRKKSQEDIENKIPFLGKIPGIGKIFGTTKLIDNSTEMFFFITPKIIKDPIEDLKMERQKFLNRRPGDIPEFLLKLKKGKKNQNRELIKNSMKVFFE